MSIASFRWAVATTLARWSKYRLYRPIKGLLALLLVGLAAWFSYSFGEKQGTVKGIVKGIDMYHSMCYNNGGIVILDGQVVGCGALGEVPKKELDNFDKRKYT